MDWWLLRPGKEFTLDGASLERILNMLNLIFIATERK
ncbi:hypothetical protein B2K_39570 [Paenibacillus mucilaginosus K02]|uniref:Uncharacterized protein n=1 Tax=Paenibacillus mucilaginosus K02 TaxID=997761 RepID=R9UN79_9BACL|nr:hypothetical protein B2K_39570 [Paenibacillus mucilaginosus K02]